ncbi:MAG: GGDEF domain-containing protein [Treponema sp.]|nr:GGDEF domain-containing protein [Treponema sp.]
MKPGRLFIVNDEKDLFDSNSEPVNDFRNTVVHAVTMILLALLAVMTVITQHFALSEAHKKVYLVFFSITLLLYLIIKIFPLFTRKHTLFFTYLFFVIFLAFTLSANYFSGQQKEYVSAICAVFIFPVLILDRTYRVNIFTSIALAICMFLSYKFKNMSLFTNDSINLLMYYFAGITVGRSVRLSRLRGYDTERILTTERNTDSLTKLANRRKLFEYLRRGDENTMLRPTGMFMIDIDKFKQYNDHYGHRAGDICLGLVGKCFAEFGERNKMKFFRYGGEEFCGLCWTKDYMELASCAEDLLQAVRDLRILFNLDGTSSGVVTISIGYAAFPREEDSCNFETMIKITDAALYSAKSHGRICARGAEWFLLTERAKSNIL